jgi:hypothetical protein
MSDKEGVQVCASCDLAPCNVIEEEFVSVLLVDETEKLPSNVARYYSTAGRDKKSVVEESVRVANSYKKLATKLPKKNEVFKEKKTTNLACEKEKSTCDSSDVKHEKKVHFADDISPITTSHSFECKELKEIVLASLCASILDTAERSLSSVAIGDHYLISKCLLKQLSTLSLLRSTMKIEKSILDMSDLYRATLLRLEKVASASLGSKELVDLQYKTTKKLCKILQILHS